MMMMIIAAMIASYDMGYGIALAPEAIEDDHQRWRRILI